MDMNTKVVPIGKGSEQLTVNSEQFAVCSLQVTLESEDLRIIREGRQGKGLDM